MAEQCTPTTEDIREDYAWYKHADGMDQDEAAAQFDRWLREHDAALIESLTDELVHKGIFAPDEGYLDAYEPSHVQWLREKARERREGVS